MPDIQQLPPSVVNKIAAGEVVERPSSVVKELLENAVDAGATRIDVSVEKGGLDAVRIADNGCGIAPGQLILAVASHATSKLRGADDLFRVATLGFRGEALASIAEVSRLVIRSRQSETAAGAELEIVGGRREEIAPCGCPVGTSLEVEQLFFNTPVRRKFMKSVPTEMGHVTEAFSRIALAHPGIHFTLRHGNRPVHDLPPVENWSERIASLYGRELAARLIWVESRDEAVRFSGYVAHPHENRSHNRMQYLFLNGRHIRDRALQHALSESYRGLLLTGRFAVAFLRLDMPPEMVDVNVHPTKLEVRFQDGGRLYSQLLGTIRTKFLSTDLNHALDAGAANAGAQAERELEQQDSAAANAGQAARETAAREELAAWAKSQLAGWESPAPTVIPAQAGNQRDAATGSKFALPDATVPTADPPSRQTNWNWNPDRRPLELTRLAEPWPANASGGGPSGGYGNRHLGPGDSETRAAAAVAARPGDGPAGLAPADGLAEDSLPRLSQFARTAIGATALGPSTLGLTPAMQVYNRYLIAETDEGVVIIDQHALHERVLYEQLRAQVLSGTLESQKLLIPETVDLTAGEAAAAVEHRELFARLGLCVEPFGDATVLVSSCPAMLRQCHPGEVLRELLDKLLSSNSSPDRRDLLDELLHMISCKAAIKAGDHLTPDEIEALLEQRHLAQFHHCPHGRPTALVFTRDDLDKQFKRI